MYTCGHWVLSRLCFGTGTNFNLQKMVVLVFKTSVLKSKHIKRLKPLLNRVVEPEGKWNFDLEDCDKILRVETRKCSSIVTSLLQKQGFVCEEL